MYAETCKWFSLPGADDTHDRLDITRKKTTAAPIAAGLAAGIEFAAGATLRNLVAVQFHPEKSGRPGLKLLDNFCRWTPA